MYNRIDTRSRRYGTELELLEPVRQELGQSLRLPLEERLDLRIRAPVGREVGRSRIEVRQVFGELLHDEFVPLALHEHEPRLGEVVFGSIDDGRPRLAMWQLERKLEGRGVQKADVSVTAYPSRIAGVTFTSTTPGVGRPTDTDRHKDKLVQRLKKLGFAATLAAVETAA